MVKTFIISLLVLSSSYLATAQTVFNKVYDIDSLNQGLNRIFECSNGDYLSADQSFQSSPFNMNTFVLRTDSFGNIIWKFEYNLNGIGIEGAADIIEISNGNILVLGVFRDSSMLGNNTYLLTLNSDGDSISSLYFNDTIISTGNKLIYQDGYFFILQWIAYDLSLADSDVRILKTDTLGNIIESWFYDTPTNDVSYDFKSTKDKGFIFSGRGNYSDPSSGFYFTKIDSSGNVEWQESYGTANYETVRTHDYLTTTQDGGYIMCGEEDLPAQQPNQGIVLKVDSIGNQLWRKEIQKGDYTNTKSLREWSDGSIIVAGGFNFYDNIPPSTIPEPRGYLTKLNANGDTVIWEREFSKWNFNDEDPIGLNSQDYVAGMILSSDGGIVVSGYQIHPFATRNDGWLIKFDSCGYTVGAEPEANFIIDSIVDSTVFITNLSTEYCIATLYFDNGDSLNISAYGNQGDQIQYTFSDTGTFIPYMYAYAGDGIDTFKTASPVITSTRQVLSISADFNVSVYPNPVQDYFIVSFGNLELKNEDEIKISLISPTGRLVKTYSLNPNLFEQQIFTHDLISGVYLVNFTLGGRSIGNKRLSVIK